MNKKTSRYKKYGFDENYTFDKILDEAKKEAVIEVEEVKEESLLTDEDKEDILHVIDPLLAKALVSTPVAKAKPKFSYLTALFYSNVYKNYHEKRLVTIAVERYKWIKSTIENNNKEIEIQRICFAEEEIG